MALCAPTPSQHRDARGVYDVYRSGAERRRIGRSVFDYRLRLTPLDEGAEQAGSVIVVGRDLSTTGIGFRHAQPLPYRSVLLEAADPRLAGIGLAEMRMEVLLRWCHFLGEGRYESGGKICRSATRS